MDDIQLEVQWLPAERQALLHRYGTTEQAFARNTSIEWKWTLEHKNNFVWAGSPSAGLKLKLKDDNDPHRDAAIPSYSQLPLSWANGGLGGTNISSLPGTPLGASLTAYTGPYTLRPAVKAPLTTCSRVFRWDMSVTPFKARNESKHWNLRHFQVGYPGSSFTSAEDVHKTGANVINIHQGVDTMINPFINVRHFVILALHDRLANVVHTVNWLPTFVVLVCTQYPFIPESVELLENYTRTANALGMRVKFYCESLPWCHTIESLSACLTDCVGVAFVHRLRV